MPITSRSVFLQQECPEQSQKQQDDYDDQDFTAFVTTVSQKHLLQLIRTTTAPVVLKEWHFVRRPVATSINFRAYQISAQFHWVEET